ncbi:ACP S-malonyltransferase [Microbacterium esteraromaticum]|uniref:[acyl-carrier-protein] S-malonyltransferase n=1 Tax=Microbacterium esteraromaticum TaxID=57043 RepID=A0A939DVX1_9MICO|nr:ACP S-malonyltransferase [Microbacterium esteraromaticum]MBN8206261.1 ACP S-malonyltransferase [Microbacterium esteraromaticum]MBN8416416.1 ACP S-malonyltransferase [Microbacterium esteraromaticum]MBN8423225.1 ACP S-malonyltransferase [Microbacterium esteraromaticum]
MVHPPSRAIRWQTGWVIVAACPGQGSQTPGFLAPWLELDGVPAQLAAFSEAAEVDLIAHGTESDADTIRDTRIAQPLIVAASIVAMTQLVQRAGRTADGLAGHSVGEIAALNAAGVIDADSAMRLVGIRGRAMADAAAQTPTGMSAVLGGDADVVLALLSELGLTPANYNVAGQIVAAGELPALAELAERAPRGVRVMPLQVAGAFHTSYMAPAVDTLRAAVDDVTPQNPTHTLWSNRDGAAVSSGQDALDRLVTQVSSPVRWDLCMESFTAAGITGFIELAPAGALVGLAKRGLRGVPNVAVKTPEDLDAAAELLNGAAA